MFLLHRKDFHAENNAGNYIGHGPVHIFIGGETPTVRGQQEIGEEGGYRKGNEGKWRNQED